MVLFGKVSPNIGIHPLTHPRAYVRFGKTEGEIQIERGDFLGDLGGFEGFGPCFGISHPPIFGKTFPQKIIMFCLVTVVKSRVPRFYAEAVRRSAER